MTSILKLKTTSGGSISLQPTDTAALLTQSLPAESGTVLLKETAAANAVYVPAGTGGASTTTVPMDTAFSIRGSFSYVT